MGKNLIRTTNFYMDLFVKQKIPAVYSRIQYWNNEFTPYEKTKENYHLPKKHQAYSIALIPDYYNLTIIESNSLIAKTFDQTNLGYAILLKSGFDIDTYLKNQLRSSHRNIKKKHARLESCYNVRYEFFYGSIEEEEYHFLMKSLHTMLVRRFNQRKDKNEKLLEWDELLANTFGQIQEKSASLFVIYDNEMPIDISINYHFHKIMFSAVSSYDIDYNRFGLGSIEKIKLLEWCLSNDYKILELGYGDLEYKRSWSNYVYHFKYQVIFNPKSLLSLIFSKFELLKLSIKEYLKSKKMDVHFNRIKATNIFRRTKDTLDAVDMEFERLNITDLNGYGELKKIDYGLESPYPLKLMVNDFIYAAIEHKNDVAVLEVLAAPGTFLISGKKNVQKITFRI